MKRNTSLPSWVTVFLVLFFSVLSGTSAVAQSNNAVVNSFVDGLRKEFMADKTMNVKSVEFKGKVLVVDSYGNGDSFIMRCLRQRKSLCPTINVNCLPSTRKF